MVHVITGATGFVGSALILEILDQTEDAIVGVVRPGAEGDPTARLRGVLRALVSAYDHSERLDRAIEARVRAVAGDVWEPRCGVTPDAEMRGAEFWHCAASLQYQDRHEAQILRTNVEGSANAVALAQRIEARRLNAVSTAYVAGSRRGVVPPEVGDLARVNNHYERSKILGEAISLGSGLPTRVLRPGIVIGHSATRHALNYNGWYGFIRGLWKFRSALERTQPGLAARTQVKMRADPEGELGLVPVDHVTAEAVGLSLMDAPPGIYHLTNGAPPSTERVLRITFQHVGLPEPILVDDVAALGSLDRKLQQGVEFYNSYLVAPKRFDRSSTDEALGHRARAAFPMDSDRLEAFCSWYGELLSAERGPRREVR